MPGPGYGDGDPRETRYWRERASEPCPKCAERERQDKAAALEQKLRAIVRDELQRLAAKPLPPQDWDVVKGGRRP